MSSFSIPIPSQHQQQPDSNPSVSHHPSHFDELQVYSQRKSNRKGSEQQTCPRTDHDTNPDLLVSESTAISDNSNGTTVDNVTTIDEELNWPITLRKGVRSCTQHPIQNYISYKGLSLGFNTFFSSMDKVQVPNKQHTGSLSTTKVEESYS